MDERGPEGPDEILDEPEEQLALYAVVGLSAVALGVGGYFLVRRFYPIGAVEFSGQRWHFHDTDKVWAARMVVGESGTSDMHAGAAVLWALAQRWVTKAGFQNMSFTSLMRAFSQPINPIWSSIGGSGCQRSPAQCSMEALARRQTIQSTSWSRIPAAVRTLVEDFFVGRVANPVPGYNNFAAAGHVSGSNSELPAVTIGGNTFVRDSGSLVGEVRII